MIYFASIPREARSAKLGIASVTCLSVRLSLSNVDNFDISWQYLGYSKNIYIGDFILENICRFRPEYGWCGCWLREVVTELIS